MASLSSEPAYFDRIFVGGLRAETTPEQIRAAFFACAGIAVGTIEIVLSRATGAPRGFAFVDLGERMDKRVDPARFARLCATVLDGQALHVRGIPVRARWR